jgi:hypothetical protein
MLAQHVKIGQAKIDQAATKKSLGAFTTKKLQLQAVHSYKRFS